MGIDRRKPPTAMRETIEVMRRLLNMENVTYHGEFHQVTGIEPRCRSWALRTTQRTDDDRRHRTADDGADR
ncbi:MAG: LLM class flavin-dependent oxidoreductase [Caldilineaceae bacterium]